MGPAWIEGHHRAGLAGLPLEPDVRRAHTERGDGRPVLQPGGDALAIPHHGHTVSGMRRDSVCGRLAAAFAIRLRHGVHRQGHALRELGAWLRGDRHCADRSRIPVFPYLRLA